MRGQNKDFTLKHFYYVYMFYSESQHIKMKNEIILSVILCMNIILFGQNQLSQITGFVYDNKSFERIPEAIIYTHISVV